MNVRAFFALRVPDRVTRKLADYADELCQFDKELQVDWVDSGNYHLTLCFLGDVSLEQVEQSLRRVLTLRSGCEPFLSFAGPYRLLCGQSALLCCCSHGRRAGGTGKPAPVFS